MSSYLTGLENLPSCLKLDWILMRKSRFLRASNYLVSPFHQTWSGMTTQNSISKRGNSKLWLLRRINSLGALKHIILDLYNKQIRFIIEYAVPVWSPGLTSCDIDELERIKQSAVNIIFGNLCYQRILMDNKRQKKTNLY